MMNIMSYCIKEQIPIYTLQLTHICDGVCLQYFSSLQSLHLDESGLHQTYFSKNFRITIFWNIPEKLFQLLNQINFWKLLQGKTSFAQYLFFSFCIGVYLSLHFAKGVTLNFKLNLTSSIPEAYSVFSQRHEMKFFVKNS